MTWRVEGSNGSIHYEEEQTVLQVLSDINYSKDICYQDTLMHIGSLPTDKRGDLVDNAIAHRK